MKHLLRQPRLKLLSLALIAAATAPGAYAATLMVDPTAVDASMASDGKCSLREAVMSINAGANQGDCVASLTEAFGNNDTLILPPGTYTLSLPGLDEGFADNGPTSAPTITNTPNAAIGDLDILKSLRILGAGAESTLIQWDNSPGAARDRIFHIQGTANVTLQDLTLSQGLTQERALQFGPASTVAGATLPTLYYLRRAGGAIAVGPAAAVVLVDPNGPVLAGSGGRGGSKQPGVTGTEGFATGGLTLTNVVISGNTAQGDGGGIYTAGPLTATGLTVAGNSSITNGGGIYTEGNTALVSSVIRSNSAEGGGGLFTTGSNTVDLKGVTLHSNRAVGLSGLGGGIGATAGTLLRLLNSTLSRNISGDTGGGLHTEGVAELRFVTIAKNLAGADTRSTGSGINALPSPAGGVTLKNVLVADNRRGYVDGMTLAQIATLGSANCSSVGTALNISSRGNNLSSDSSCAGVLNLAGDLNSKDPLIGELAANGGFGLTHALAAGSPALAAGQPEADVSMDQRGTARDATPDIGAFELPTVATVSPPNSVISGSLGGGCSTNPDADFDPGLPTLLLAALGSLFWRRRKEGLSA